MEKGTVKMYCKDNGWGVITTDENGQELFVQHSNIIKKKPKRLIEGEKVVFETKISSIGLEAVNIKVLRKDM